MSTTWTVPRQSTEWVGPITIKNGDVEVTDWTVAVFPRHYQPVDASEISEPPTSVDGLLGVLVGPASSWPLTPGTYRLWVTFSHPPEAPVINTLGLIKVT